VSLLELEKESIKHSTISFVDTSWTESSRLLREKKNKEEYATIFFRDQTVACFSLRG
jgi:hypothetical protein